MASIVNLNRFRKAKKREEAQQRAAENRALFGRSKKERRAADSERQRTHANSTASASIEALNLGKRSAIGGFGRLVETDEDHRFGAVVRRQMSGDGAHRDSRRRVARKAVDSGGNCRKGDRDEPVLAGDPQRVAVAGRKGFRLAGIAALPDRPDRVDDVRRRQPIAASQFRLARRAAAQRAASRRATPGQRARWIAPSTPPPPSSDALAALTMASTASRVMSPISSLILGCIAGFYRANRKREPAISGSRAPGLGATGPTSRVALPAGLRGAVRRARGLLWVEGPAHRLFARGPARQIRARHDRLGLAVGDDAHQPAQRLAAARQARADGADRDAHHLGDLLVAHPFETDEQDHRALLLGQPGEGAVEVAQFERAALIRGSGQRRLGFVDRDRRAFTHRAADLIDVLVVQDGEEPCPQIRAFLPQVQLCQPAHQAILNEIVGGCRIAGQRASVAPQARNFGFDLPTEVGHGEPRLSRSAQGRSERRGL